MELDLSQEEIVRHSFIFIVSIIVFLFSPKLFSTFSTPENFALRSRTFRTIIVVFWFFQIVDIFFAHTVKEYENIFIKTALSILLICLFLVLFSLVTLVSRKRFGYQKTVDGESHYVDSYNSRLAEIIGFVVLMLFITYLLIELWGLDSLLSTTGFFGILFAFLAFTNSIWAPDIFHGMVILNSNLLEDGDTIRLGGDENLYIISRVSFIYTVLLNVKNNHRTIIKNSQILKDRIENLTQQASREGLRQYHEYRVSYPSFSGLNENEKREKLDVFFEKINSMFTSAEEVVKSEEGINFNQAIRFEWYLSDPGDYALVLRFYYYLAPLPITILARKIRKHVYGAHYRLIKEVYQQSVLHGIDLSTPILVDSTAPAINKKVFSE